MIQINHIGVAVKDVPAIQKLFSILGLSVQSTEEVMSQGVKTHFIPVEGQLQVELLEPIDPQGTVAQFIQKKGPGIHHLSFIVSAGQLDSLLERLRNEGYRLVYPEARDGAHQMRVNFIHPASAGGMLIEIMEPTSKR